MATLSLSIQKLMDFNVCIQHSLADIRSTGSKWSWHNKAVGDGRIIGRLDRIMCNEAWIDLLPHTSYAYLNHAFSDHSPMLMHLLDKPMSAPRPFKFFNYWMQHDGFVEVAEQAWNSDHTGFPVFRVINKLKDIKVSS